MGTTVAVTASMATDMTPFAAAPQHLTYIPSPPIDGFPIGPLYVHFYGLMYVIGIALAIYITRRRWQAAGGDGELVYEVAIWGVPAGIVGGRIYFDITTPFDITPKTWWGPLAVWNGGLGIWGGVALAAVVGAWRVRRSGAGVGEFMNAVAPALLVAQAIGRIGNYFNQELFGKPSSLPWAVGISPEAQLRGGIPAADVTAGIGTFQPSFLYELIFDLAWAAVLVWLGHHRRIRPQGLFALYIAGYSGYRIFEETIRVDSSAYFLGLRLNFFVALAMTVIGLIWFAIVQFRPSAGREEPDKPDESTCAATAIDADSEAAGVVDTTDATGDEADDTNIPAPSPPDPPNRV
ncbi:MAG: prolipoprotein diacylglyceryl transferase [Actinobacteria bacterium 69-20]|jgi:prolipoprotein diacylglyceryl transferase|nr:MAG: prolipoprotein diacylglyceryl transferase [Actinobacteria bacterium 69-20]